MDKPLLSPYPSPVTLLRYTLSTSGRPSNPSSQTLALLNQSLPQIHFLRKIITTGLSTAYPGLSTDPPHSPPIVSMNIYLSIYLSISIYIYIHIHIYTHTHARMYAYCMIFSGSKGPKKETMGSNHPSSPIGTSLTQAQATLIYLLIPIHTTTIYIYIYT